MMDFFKTIRGATPIEDLSGLIPSQLSKNSSICKWK